MNGIAKLAFPHWCPVKSNQRKKNVAEDHHRLAPDVKHKRDAPWHPKYHAAPNARFQCGYNPTEPSPALLEQELRSTGDPQTAPLVIHLHGAEEHRLLWVMFQKLDTH